MQRGLGQQALGHLSPGDFIIVHYDFQETEWHARLLLSHVGSSAWVILTPDGDLYIEELGGPDIIAWRVYDPNGPSPYGIDATKIYNFRNLPGDAARVQLLQEGERHAAADKSSSGSIHLQDLWVLVLKPVFSLLWQGANKQLQLAL